MIDRALKAPDEGRSLAETMQVSVTVAGAGTGSRLGRLPFVLLLTLGLLVSLIHCGGCDFGFTRADAASVVMNLDQGSGPDTPEQTVGVP